MSGTSSGYYGVYGTSSTLSGVYGSGGMVGVEGYGNNNGVAGRCNTQHLFCKSASGAGVYGENFAANTNGNGVTGAITTNGVGAAVKGDATNSATAWAGNFIGDVQARGFYNASDARLKTDIKDATYGLPELLRLRPVTYKWKSGGERRARNGLIAQEVQAVFPSAIRVDGNTGMMSVDYVSILPVAIKAIQQQQQTIDRLQTRVEELERKSPPVVSSTFWTAPGALLGLMVLPVGVVIARRKRG